MRFYPELPARRTATVVRDVLIVAALIVLAVLAIEVHDRVDALSAAGRGVQDAGRSVQRRFDSAASAVDGVPLVGGELSGALSGAGEGTGGEAVVAGRTAVLSRRWPRRWAVRTGRVTRGARPFYTADPWGP